MFVTWMGALMWSIGRLKLQLCAYAFALAACSMPFVIETYVNNLENYLVILILGNTCGLLVPFGIATLKVTIALEKETKR